MAPFAPRLFDAVAINVVVGATGVVVTFVAVAPDDELMASSDELITCPLFRWALLELLGELFFNTMEPELNHKHRQLRTTG